MKTINYVIGMTEEKMTEKVKEMIAYMRTDEYWIERGDSSPDYTEGSWLMKEYLKMTDNKLVERKDTLIVSYNKALHMRTFKTRFGKQSEEANNNNDYDEWQGV